MANPRTEKKITPKQEEFVRIYCCEDVSQTEAAVRAGYSKKSAHAIASQLLNGTRYPHVVARVYEVKNELAHKYEVTFEKHIKELARLREEALKKGAFSAATNAEKNRGMAAGLYIDRKIIKTGKLEEMSEAELELKMKQILEDYAPILNAKVVDALPEEINEVSSSSKRKKSGKQNVH